ncbi:uncharacterized protein DS421_10g309870 [Arachis hypogaea]|nr:uncharacterized protein DS421_10g309870 [Arachis hypogaea]
MGLKVSIASMLHIPPSPLPLSSSPLFFCVFSLFSSRILFLSSFFYYCCCCCILFSFSFYCFCNIMYFFLFV